jgi:peroxiredoxin
MKIIFVGKWLVISLSFALSLVSCSGVVRETQGREAGNGVYPSAKEVRPLLNGTQIPDVSLVRSDGARISLRALVGGKPSILVFYRGSWCPFCNLQFAGLGRVQPDIEKLGFQLIGISPDTPEKETAFSASKIIPYVLLSDSELTAAKAFGIAFQVDPDTIKRMEGFGVSLDSATGHSLHQLPVPAVFVLDKDGVINYEYVNPDFKYRLDPAVLMAMAESTLNGNAALKK